MRSRDPAFLCFPNVPIPVQPIRNMPSRRRPIWIALAVLAAAWLLALGGFGVARSLKVTPEKVLAYMHQTDLSRLSGPERAAALRKLAAMLNALSLEERRQARLDKEWPRWLAAMTDEEKGGLMEATLPTGFNQMLTAFEKMPADKRRQAVEDAVKRMRENRKRQAEEGKDGEVAMSDTNAPPEMSPELREQAVKLGLKTFYDSGSAQMKAELAPVLEEMQQDMESGRMFRQNFRRRPE